MGRRATSGEFQGGDHRGMLAEPHPVGQSVPLPSRAMNQSRSRRRPVVAVAVALTLLLAACSSSDGSSTVTSSTVSSSAASSSAVPLSTAPSSTAAVTGGPGSLVSAEPVSGFVGRGWRVLYGSTSLADEPIEVSGLVMVPSGDPPPGGWPVVSWAHGTTGLADECAPSRDPGSTLAVAEVVLAQGYMVVATDYEGLGTPGPHPYLVGESEGRGVLDIARLARDPMFGGSDRVLIWGASQGGQAALFAGQIAGRYAPDLDVVGVVASAPASGMAGAGRLAGTPLQGFLAMGLAGIAAARPELDLTPYVTEEALSRFDALEQGCTAEVFAAFADLDADSMIHREAWSFPMTPDDGPLGLALWENDPGREPVAAPVLIVQGDADLIVRPDSTAVVRDRLCSLGTQVDYRLYEGAGHVDVNTVSVLEVLDWITARFEGVAPPAELSCAGL